MNETDQQTETENEKSKEEILAEGETAADYVEGLLDIAEIDGDIDIEIKDNRTYIYIFPNQEKSKLEILIGKQGEILSALQELSRLAVISKYKTRSRLILDIADYRLKRKNALEEMVKNAIQEVKESGENIALEPMVSYERKMVHDIITKTELSSYSEGFHKNRHVVISL